jgi:glutamine amidotransferase
MIVIIDYGAGNLRSVEKAFNYLGCKVAVSSNPQMILQADKVILPGVGAFGKAMENLTRAGLIPTVKEIIRSKRPLLGICLGLQMLFEENAEVFGEQKYTNGLGVFAGNVLRLPLTGVKVPQIGWNQIKKNKEVPLLHGIPDGSFVYFVHSYYVKPVNPDIIACTTHHGIEYCSGIYDGSVTAFQFHPEKSSQVGLQIFKNFANQK